ncbi:MAG: hypothetical protein ABIE70_05570 [bacterium]
MSLRSIVGGIKINRMKRHLEPKALAFPESVQKTSNILICLPAGLRELTLVKQFLPQIKEVFRPAQITLLSLPGIRVNDIYPRKGFQILCPSADQVTWSGLPKKSYLETLAGYKFDLVLDMNLSPSPFTRGILLGQPQAVRVGRGNYLGEPFYNLEIKTKYLRDERNIYRSLLNMLTIIKRGPADTQPDLNTHPTS